LGWDSPRRRHTRIAARPAPSARLPAAIGQKEGSMMASRPAPMPRTATVPSIGPYPPRRTSICIGPAPSLPVQQLRPLRSLLDLNQAPEYRVRADPAIDAPAVVPNLEARVLDGLSTSRCG